MNIKENIDWAKNLEKSKVPITRFPYVLPIKFSTIETFTNTTYDYQHLPISIPENLNLSNEGSNNSVPYKIVALIVHPSAHYVSYLRDGNKWVCFNDSNVTSLDTLPDTAKKQVVFAVYERDNKELRSWATTA